MEKKKTNYLALNFVIILVLAITSISASLAYENSKNEIRLIEQRHKSIGNSSKNINGSADSSLEKLCKLITRTLEDKYDLLMDEFEKKYNSMTNLLEDKYKLLADELKKNSDSIENESFASSFERKMESAESFIVSRENKKGYIGYHTLLECNAANQSNSMENHWYKNGKEINTSNKSKYTLQNGDLEIKSLTTNDAGNYSCLLIYGDNNYKKASYNLKIQHAYKWIVPGSQEAKDPSYELFNFGDEKLNLAQTNYNKSLLPGVTSKKSSESTISIRFISNNTYLETNKFKILMINKNVEYDWVDESDGNVPPNALEAGQLASGEKLYIGSSIASQELGVVQPSAKNIKIFILNYLVSSGQYKRKNYNLISEIGSIKKQYDSVGSLVDEKYKLITNLLEEKYKILIDLSEKKKKSFADEFNEKYQLEALFNVSSVDKVGYTGNDTVLECNTGEERPIAMEYHWYYNGNELDTSNSNKYTTHNGDLKIKNSTLNDAGIYRCLLTYGHNYKNITYNLETKHAYQLVDFDSIKKFRDLGYKTIDDDEGDYLGQTKYDSNLLPGKIYYDSAAVAYIKNINVSMSYIFNDKYYKTNDFKVFMLHENFKYSWIEKENGDVAPNALEAGQLANGEKLYVGMKERSFGVGHQEQNSFQMTFQLIYNGVRKNNESSLPANLHDKENNPMLDKYDKTLEAFEKTFKEKYDSFEGYIGYHTLLDCDLEGHPNSFEIHWFYNRRRIDTSNKEKYELHGGALEIKNLTENDAGNYRCLLVYDGIFKRASYDLKIHHAYKWVDEGSPEMKDPAFEKFSFNDKFNFGHIDNGESIVPCVIRENTLLTIQMLNDDVKKTGKVKILMINKDVEYDWVDDSDGHVPPNALEAGQLADGEKFYIGSTLDSQKLGLIKN
ncbi:hypothetical protein HCN44_011198 [Aphidius gifuensis]|uniref:Ig-like domain-containing protein n=1 Tax=Aphidius gifuensis TaxID=684658 RepID=A0A835CRG2_APHGI|nr:hypothetical protein HCN44_011198 [Aphidius gifuensis]